MLNQLIESKNHGAENARKNSFLVSTLGVLVAVLLSGWTYSLFAKNFGMGTGEFEFASVVAPVIPTEEPPAPEPERKQPEKAQAASDDQKPSVIEKIARMEDSLDNPPKVEDSRVIKSSPLKRTEWNDYEEGKENRYRNTSERDGTEDGGGIKQTTSKTDEDTEKEPEVVVKPKPVPTPEKPVAPPRVQSGGVLNGKAIKLVTPPYPAAARAMGIKDTVQVQVLIDEQGNVVSATAASGNPLLRGVAVAAARASKFSPTKLSNQPVKVTGVIVYQFK